MRFRQLLGIGEACVGKSRVGWFFVYGLHDTIDVAL